MYKNVGDFDRLFRITIALSLLGLIFFRSLSFESELTFMILSFYLLYTSLSGQCIVYLIFLFSTKKKESRVIIKECSNNIITVYWSEKKCLNYTMCVNEIKLKKTKYQKIFEFFHPKNKPWIKSYGNKSTGEIINAIENCTSGALNYEINTDSEKYKEMLKRKSAEVEFKY